MQLNHINLVVKDVAEAVKLFETYFSFRCLEVKGDNVVAVLENEHKFSLVLMASKTEPAYYPEAFHIGFMMESREAVDALHNKLRLDSIQVGEQPRNIRGGYGFYFHFEALMIEVGLEMQ